MSDFVLWEASTEIRNSCVLGAMRGFDEIYDLKSGKSFAGVFPEDVEFEMSPDFPRNTVLTDNLMNEEGVVVCSAALKQFLEARGTACIEYLPVAIRNHKNRIASKDYFIITPLEPIDCLDETASGAEENLILPGEFDSVQRLVLMEEKIDPTREIFRIARFPNVTVVRRGLALQLSEQKFTGVRWVELGDFPEV